MTSYRQRFIDAQGFGLDRFQLQALDAYDQGVNVLVSAPTGSGKTLVANYAIGATLESNKRSFYTTPLKALSNQKYAELCSIFGDDSVGLLTGDTSINRHAKVVVMTTEVLRNMLLADIDQLRTLGLVVMDEVHYLQDPFRGGVWEEVLILTPPAVRFVALSATVGNAPFLGKWFTQVRGETSVIVETNRPITLHQHIAVVKRGHDLPDIIDLLDDERLSDQARKIDNTMKATRRFRPGPKWHGPKSSAPPSPFRPPKRSELLMALERDDLLPVIVFIFSRAACDDAVRQCRRDGLDGASQQDARAVSGLRLGAVLAIAVEPVLAQHPADQRRAGVRFAAVRRQQAVGAARKGFGRARQTPAGQLAGVRHTHCRCPAIGPIGEDRGGGRRRCEFLRGDRGAHGGRPRR